MGTQRYFEGIRQETEVCKTFQEYLENANKTKTYLQKRPKTNAHIDFIGREYEVGNGKTIRELAVEVRTLQLSAEEINKKHGGYIYFPSTKLNECMQFWRMSKTVYIVYQLLDMTGYLDWDYYIRHNFCLTDDKNWLLLPLKNFIQIS